MIALALLGVFFNFSNVNENHVSGKWPSVVSCQVSFVMRLKVCKQLRITVADAPAGQLEHLFRTSFRGRQLWFVDDYDKIGTPFINNIRD